MNGIILIATSLYEILKNMEKNNNTTPMVTIPLSEYERMREEISNKEVLYGDDIKHANEMLLHTYEHLNKRFEHAMKENKDLEDEIDEMNDHIKLMTRQRDKFLRITYVEGIIIVILAACCAVLMR